MVEKDRTIFSVAHRKGRGQAGGCNGHDGWGSSRLVPMVGILESKAVTQRFQASILGNPFQALLALKQEETVQGFIDQFEKCVGMVKGLEEPFLVEVFLKGLKEETSTKVRHHEPKNLMEASYFGNT